MKYGPHSSRHRFYLVKDHCTFAPMALCSATVNDKPRKTIKANQSLAKAFRIIEQMAAQKGPLRLQEISSLVGIPASTTLRFISTLTDLDYVVQDTNTLKYSLTLKLCSIAEQIRSRHSLRDIVREELLYLTELCGESSCLAVEERSEVVYIDVVEGPDNLLQTLQRIGKRAPLHSTGVGKSLLVNYSSDELRNLATDPGLKALTSHTITTLDALVVEIDKVRAQHVAIDDEECEAGVRCVAAPVRDYSNRVVCSISISGPIYRMHGDNLNRCAENVRAAAKRLSLRLGYTFDTVDAIPIELR